MSVPTYAYAANNPIKYIDPTGLDYDDMLSAPGRAEAFRTAAQTSHYNRNQYNVTPDYATALEQWIKMSDKESIYHRHGKGNEKNEKFISRDGRCEAVYRDGQLVTDPANMGTYNFGPPIDVPGKIEHFFKDVVPYWAWGNTPTDPTPAWNRVTGP